MSDITLRLAGDADTLTLSMLATQVFLDTYATDGIRPSIAREARSQLGPDAIRSLLAQAETHAAAQGAAVLWLTCWARNARALAFYARQRYTELGVTGYVFEGERHENRVLAKALRPAADMPVNAR
jgi:hypothetical protein